MENYSISEAKEAIKTGIKGYLAKDESGNYYMKEIHRLPFYLEGCPGIGKTQIVSEVASDLQIGFVSFSITHHSRNTVLGLPVIREMKETKYTEYTMSEILAKVLEHYQAGEKEGILLLDEFNCMSDTIMPVMLSFLQTKNIGMYTLPEGWVIILCGNPESYNHSARKFDAAIMDRLRKLPIEFACEDFYAYAKKNNFEPEIQEFLKLSPESIYLCTSGKEENLVTSRGWENLDITLKMLRRLEQEPDEKMIRQFLKSQKVSKEFHKFYWMQRSVRFDVEDYQNILHGIHLEHYAELMGDMKLNIRLDILETLVKLICGKVKEKEIAPNIGRDYISNVIKIFVKLGDDSCLERVFTRINEEKELIRILNQHESKEYIALAQKYYYGKAAM